MDKIIKYKTPLLVLGFSLFLFFIPDQVYGFVLDLAKKQVTALSTNFGLTAGVFFITGMFFLIGYFYLLITTSLLQGIIMATPTALTVTGGGVAEIVRAGWSLSAGIVNLILIIAFIVIAFAVILGSEKIQLKKALPNLIMVALLVNFTLLFVGIGIDISNFLFNTIANQFMTGGAGGNIFRNALMPLIDFGNAQLTAISLYLIGMTTKMLVPYVSTAVQYAFSIGTPFILSSVFQFIFYGIIMWALSGVFFLFYIIFLARIFIIQILAMLAPLAFFCLIFDNTKKHWDKWLKTLIEWLFVGVIFIFLMYFALALAPLVQALGAQFELPSMLRWFTGDIISHIVLLIYFLVVVGVAKGFVPAAANTLISQAQGLVKTATPWAGAIATGAAKSMRESELKRKENIKDRKTIEKPNFITRVGTRAMEAQSWAVKRGHNIVGTSIGQESKKDIESRVKGFKDKHGDDYEDFVENFRLTGLQNETSKIAALQYLSEGGADAFAKFDDAETLGNFIKLASERGDLKTVKNAVKHIPGHSDILGQKKALEEARAKAKEKFPTLTGTELEFKIKSDKKVIQAQKNLDIAEKIAGKIETAMMPEIKKIDPNISRFEKELESAKEKLNNTTGEARNKILKEIKKKEEEIQTAKTAAIHKISAQSLKSADIEKLSSDTLKNEGFLKAVVENRNMNFIQSILDRNDAPEVIKNLTNIITDEKVMGIKKLKETNSTLYNQIKNTSAGQGMLGDVHEKITASEKGSPRKKIILPGDPEYK